jgi:transglutaminase-like putative cysteine protease
VVGSAIGANIGAAETGVNGRENVSGFQRETRRYLYALQQVAAGALIALMYQLEGVPRVVRGTLPAGHAGTGRTLQLMRQLAREGAATLTVKQAAVAIVRAAGVAGHDFAGEMDALFRFVRDRIRYAKDPVGIEDLQSPRFTLENRTGDCDDKATLLASLLLAIGHPADVRFRVIGTHPLSEQFSHVYVVVNANGRRIALDPTRTGTPLGWEYPRPSVTGEVSV